MLRSHGLDVVPGQELIDLALPMSIDDSGEGLGQTAVRFHSVQLAGLAEGGQNCPILGPGFVTCEKTVFATDGNGADGAFWAEAGKTLKIT